MRFMSIAVVAVIFQASFSWFPSRTVAQDLNGACNGAQCGMGTCRISPDRVFGFVCDCIPGWSQLRFNKTDDPFGFLPCIIPNCTFDYACYNDTLHKSAPSIPAPSSFSLFDACLWSYCGAGECVRLPGLNHRCDCKEGFTNILNVSSFPCYKDCAVGADCPNLGFQLSNASFPPTTFYQSGVQASSSVNNWAWLFLTAHLWLWFNQHGWSSDVRA